MITVANTEIIEFYIKLYNLSKTQICKKCKISRPTLDKLLKEKQCKLTTLQQLAKLFNISIDLFLSNNNILYEIDYDFINFENIYLN